MGLFRSESEIRQAMAMERALEEWTQVGMRINRLLELLGPQLHEHLLGKKDDSVGGVFSGALRAIGEGMSKNSAASEAATQETA